jgi:hypothetical protein
VPPFENPFACTGRQYARDVCYSGVGSWSVSPYNRGRVRFATSTQLVGTSPSPEEVRRAISRKLKPHCQLTYGTKRWILSCTSDRWHRHCAVRRSLQSVSFVLRIGCVFFTVFILTIEVLVAGEMIIGLFLGCFNVRSPTYSFELCPTAPRGVLMSFVLTYRGVGRLLAQRVFKGVDTGYSCSYRILFAGQ